MSGQLVNQTKKSTDTALKPDRASASPEPKKESRLTTIIDQLLINKSKDADTKMKQKDRPSAWQILSDNVDLDVTSGARPRGRRDMPTDALAPAAAAGSSNPAVKSERPSPEPESSSSPSVSPHSPSPARAFPSLLAPGFGLAALRVNSAAPFSPPPGLERFSPAANPAIKQMEMMTRNYSDFMRSLAAKYNNQNNAQDSFPMPQSNGLVRGFESPFGYKGAAPFLQRSIDVEGNGGGCSSGGMGRKMDAQGSPSPHDVRSNSVGNNSVAANASEFSSSQTLLNLVRTASAQSASQLENYLKGAVKRSSDLENRLDPLDLTVNNVKRPKFECSALRDDAEGEPLRSPFACGGARPAWMAADKRLPTPPTRTSPKILSSERSRCVSMCAEKSCSSHSESNDLAHWTVDDVVSFVSSVETCSEYAEKFREHSIDGTTLPLLTEDHLTMHLGLKLGPALKLRSTLARKIGHCALCMHCMHCHGDDAADVRRLESSRSPSVSK